jgi:Cu/Ag efflux protein CusF
MTNRQFLHMLATGLTVAALTAPALAQSLPLAQGEVRKVDKAAGKISLKHGEIKNLDMPPMSMVFQAQDPALLNKVKVGDKVVFTADQIKGGLHRDLHRPANCNAVALSPWNPRAEPVEPRFIRIDESELESNIKY